MQSAVIIGNLDGVHRGHQALVQKARAMAQARGLETVVLTFDPHPTEVLTGVISPKLSTLERRIELLRRCGADRVVVEPFTRTFSTWTPEKFVKELLVDRLEARAVVVGENFRFGAERAGSVKELHAFGATFGFDVASEVASDDRGMFSSSRVRDAIVRGDLEEARYVLGRWHSVSGVVEGGDRRGRTIGFPTANLGGVTEVLPPHGVYAVCANGHPGVMNIGVRPTVDGTSERIEVHLFDFDGDLYGQTMRVFLVARIRDEKKFAGLDELKAQIATDAQVARAILAPLLTAESGPCDDSS